MLHTLHWTTQVVECMGDGEREEPLFLIVLFCPSAERCATSPPHHTCTHTPVSIACPLQDTRHFGVVLLVLFGVESRQLGTFTWHFAAFCCRRAWSLRLHRGCAFVPSPLACALSITPRPFQVAHLMQTSHNCATPPHPSLLSTPFAHRAFRCAGPSCVVAAMSCKMQRQPIEVWRRILTRLDLERCASSTTCGIREVVSTFCHAHPHPIHPSLNCLPPSRHPPIFLAWCFLFSLGWSPDSWEHLRGTLQRFAVAVRGP